MGGLEMDGVGGWLFAVDADVVLVIEEVIGPLLTPASSSADAVWVGEGSSE